MVLSQLALGHLADLFRENGVDGEFLSQCTKEELVSELGLTALQATTLFMRLPASQLAEPALL